MYGVNVAIAVIAALALLVLLNFLVQFSVTNVAPKYRTWLRYDLTSTREHSLSAQTLKVLGEINEPYKIVAFIGTPDSTSSAELAGILNRASDLVDEYSQYNRKLQVEKLNPERDITKTAEFYRTLQQRYEPKLKPMKALKEEGQKAADDVKHTSAKLNKSLGELVKSNKLAEGRNRDFMENLAQAYGRMDRILEMQLAPVARIDKQPLPDYAAAIQVYDQALSAINEGVLTPSIAGIRRAADTANTPGDVKEMLLAMVEEITSLRTRVTAATDKLHAAAPDDDYRRLREQVESGTYFLVVMSPTAERVVKLDDMFRVDARQKAATPEGEATPDYTFLGEEVLTGALASLQIKKPPMAVFVSMGGQEDFSQVSDRLSKLGFRVERWSPTPRQTQFGMMPPGPPPRPEPGQKAVWIVPPITPDMNDPRGPGASAAVMRVIQERAAQGDGVLLMTGYSPMSQFGGPDIGLAFLEPWGIKPLTDRVIFREEPNSKGKPMPVAALTTSEWSADLPVTKALAGMSVLLRAASPLELDPKAKEKDVQLYPLVVIKNTDLWAQKDLMNRDAFKKTPETAAPQFTVGAAAQSKTGRLIVIAESGGWATDDVTRAVDMEGFAVFPGNAELFVNSVEWLAGLENLIAASPRSQDFRRISDISSTKLLAIKFGILGAVPLVTIITGIAVWLVRRRG